MYLCLINHTHIIFISMELDFSSVIFWVTFILTFISNHHINKDKRLYDMKEISNIMQIDALFDILVITYRQNENVRWIYLVYTLAFPLYIIFLSKNTVKKGLLSMMLVIFISLTIYYSINFYNFKPYINFYIYPTIIIHIIAIGFCIYRSVHYDRILKPKNYFYYLLLGFMILDLFYFLSFYRVFPAKLEVFLSFAEYTLIYLNILRLAYILYVLNALKHVSKPYKS